MTRDLDDCSARGAEAAEVGRPNGMEAEGGEWRGGEWLVR